MDRTITIAEAKRGLQAFVGGLVPAIREAVRRGLEPLRSDIEKGARRTRVGRALFIRRGLRPFISSGLGRSSATSVQGFVDASGFAAMIEEGGHTKRHIINPRRGEFLSFVAGGRTVFVRRVLHPGSRIRREAFMVKASRGGEDEMARGIDRGLQATGDRLIG